MFCDMDISADKHHSSPAISITETVHEMRVCICVLGILTTRALQHSTAIESIQAELPQVTAVTARSIGA
jgi:hypothetical protein